MTSDLRPPASASRPRTSDLGLRYALRADVALEDFGEKSLVLLCGSLRMREINAASRKLLALLDGERTVADIARAADLDADDVRAALLEMERQGMVRRVVEWKKERPGNMSDATYMADPDVSFRQEGGEGGILYNADTDSLEVVNPVAAEIWMFLSAPRTQAEVVAHLCAVCEGADPAQVERDVGEFLESMLQKGFVGVVEASA
jgi:hypothetical protein